MAVASSARVPVSCHRTGKREELAFAARLVYVGSSNVELHGLQETFSTTFEVYHKIWIFWLASAPWNVVSCFKSSNFRGGTLSLPHVHSSKHFGACADATIRHVFIKHVLAIGVEIPFAIVSLNGRFYSSSWESA